MGVQIFLGEPPASIKQWIIDHYAPAPSELGTPLYFRGNEPSASVAMLALKDYVYEPTDLQCHLQYSTDGMATWAAYGGHVVELDECIDNKVYFRADPENPNADGFYINDIYHYFKTDKSVAAGGNIQFLLESTGTRTDVPEWGFYWMFSGPDGDCASLMTAPLLPATTLANNCYGGMFGGCTSLTQAPALPATTLADWCYNSMFYGCTSLVQAPALPATTLANNCYGSMFGGCTSLVQAPALPATTLASNCYYCMFYGCTSLTSMDVSFTEWNPSDATYSWVQNAGSEASGTKTFTCPSGLPQTFGENNIPSGWTVVTK